MAGRGEAIRIESGAVAELAALYASPVFWGRGIPRGDGRMVVVVPGLFGNDVYLTPLRQWLRRIGYRPVRSALAVNAGCGKRLLSTIEDNLRPQLATTERPIALVGHSRGGMLCWALAARLGPRVSHLALVGSPAPAVVEMFRQQHTWSSVGVTPGGVAAAGRRATQLLDPDCDVPACGCAFVQDLARRLDPATRVLSIHSSNDPIVPPSAARLPAGAGANVVVTGSHGGLTHNRAVLRHLAEFLAEPPR